jgi:hypothetical protein
MDYRLEVIGIPVSDVDASKALYSDVVGSQLIMTSPLAGEYGWRN